MSENTSLPAPENTNPVEILAGGPTAFAVRDIHQPPADPLTINQSPIDRSAVGQSSVGTGEYLPSALKTEDPIMVVGLQFATVRRAVKWFVSGVFGSDVDIPDGMEAYRAIRNARAAVARDAEKVVNPMTETPEKPTIH